nr:receptor-type tyrosine-protein phosphatase epsilon isoform X3 [Crassostrea gigas]
MNFYSITTHILGIICATAFDDLSYKQYATQLHTSIGNLYDASNAVDRNPSTCTRTLPIGHNNPNKTVWWRVDLGGIHSIYKINIVFKDYNGSDTDGKDHTTRQRGRFAGFSLYLSDTGAMQESTLCYKKEYQIPHLNFSAACTDYKRYVIFHNERLDGVTYPKGYEANNVYTELCEVIVLGCKNSGVYGSNCDQSCAKNCKDYKCNIIHGDCFSCKPGWTGNLCNTKCSDGSYGDNCSRQCSGHCRHNIACNYVTGQCDKGCTEGWFSLNCSQQCKGQCREDITCNETTGLCNKGCDAGWSGDMCDKECDDETYGYNCVNRCSGHCLNNYPCNKQTGHCDGGCQPGYTNSDCGKNCLPGYFGEGCGVRCSGHCIKDEPCDHITGECSIGCQDGYTGARCDKECEKGHYGRNCSLICSPNCKTCRHTDGLCKCKAGWMGPNCTNECILSYGENCQYQCSQHCINETCDRFDGSCQKDCDNEESCKLVDMSDSNDLSATVGGTVGSIVLLIIGIVIAVFFLRLRRKAKTMTKRESIVLGNRTCITLEHRQSYKEGLIPQKGHANDVKIYADVSHEKTTRGPPSKKYISVRNIKAQITNMSANESSGFKTEYNDIPRGELHQSLEAKKTENKVKNRYTTIYPYDHSRVILKSNSSTEGDYINANYIEDAQGKRIYIATQGPKPKTIPDFWSMIWQEEVCNIVCLTNLKEGTKNKCAQYWPDLNNKLQGGTLTVRHLEEKTYAEYTMRRFKMHNKTTRTDRHVTMFHYTTWSDHGVADPLSLVVFHRHVIRATANAAGKYIVVHCSAGVGRTGTYIALDALYREGERTGKINVPMYVRTMRKDRMNMIQGDEQYKLLYLALMEAFSGPSRCLTTEKFVGAYQEQTCYANRGDVVQTSSQSIEFEELLSMRKKYTQRCYTSGRAQISANYTQSVLSVEEYMCHLSTIEGHITYYNAILLQSYLETDSLISAQYPLPDNTEDFLRLVNDFDARVVVFLCPLEDIDSTQAWFPTANHSKLNGLFVIKNTSSTQASNVRITNLNIQKQEFTKINITVVECPTWKEGKGTTDKRVLLDVIKAVKTEKSDQEGRIIVLSSDGVTRCGPFCVVYNVLEQISVDREVDIFTTTRQLQVRRPEFVSTLDEYQLCHDAVAEYLINDRVMETVTCEQKNE